MHSERLAFDEGWRDTRRALGEWNRAGGRVVGPWAAVSFTIGIALLVAVWSVSRFLAPSPEWIVWTFNGPRTLNAAAHILLHNGTVLIMHSFICVAGFMA